jgi:alkylated DNA repair dioxygenase AlkB
MDMQREQVINKEDCTAYVVRGWYGDATSTEEAFKALVELPWQKQSLKMYGKTVPEARYSLNCGETYPFNSALAGTQTTHAWDAPGFETVGALRTRLVEELNFDMNNCFMNYYPQGKDYIGYHHDKHLA